MPELDFLSTSEEDLGEATGNASLLHAGAAFYFSDGGISNRDYFTEAEPIAAVAILAGVQLLALGLLGEMQVHRYYEPNRQRPYSVERVLRTEKEQSTRSS